MTTKQDISNYVAFQQFQNQLDQVYYLTVRNYDALNQNGLNNITISKAKLECKLTEAEMVKEVDTILSSFEPYQADSVLDQMATDDEVAIKIEEKCKRGIGNTRYKNSFYYKGDKKSDSPIIVAEFEDKYGVFKHPNFERYGYVLEA
jgi:hypothetical protein